MNLSKYRKAFSKPTIARIICLIICVISFIQCEQSIKNNHLKTILNAISKDNKFQAEIKSDNTFSNYFLEVKYIGIGSSVLLDTLICVKGYHDPVFNLKWNDIQSSFELSVDNDFGENIQFYFFDVMTNKLRESKSK